MYLYLLFAIYLVWDKMGHGTHSKSVCNTAENELY